MISRTVELVGLTEIICPIAAELSVTGMPTASPEMEPLSMVMVELHESLDPEITRAPVDLRLYVF